ncbi:four helix bundle protein [Flavobacterium dauae]|uniref:four helix bundle protein n=1 Tax=Flavobacterium dauae TaxID=1563479 RepID=UPI00101B4F77|nr:four helix bundle protein [Flavobacterium dauae]WLD23210.1 four helix bundle protein [Flavobacterium dauae]
MYDYKKYIVWQKSHQLVLNTYAFTNNFPKNEQYNLTSQINRAALSIPTNIAEGCGRNGQKEFIKFLNISSGSATELDYLFLLAKDLNFIPEEDYLNLNEELIEIRKMLFALIQKIASTLN